MGLAHELGREFLMETIVSMKKWTALPASR
jgi:hypothetical protein